jgi:tRNA(Ser,Leu) C12 N-acetylase TAN1
MLKKFNEFKTTDLNNISEEALNIITESIESYMSKDTPSDTDKAELNKIQKDVLSKYDLPKSDIDNIKSRISDAISKKATPNTDVNVNTDNNNG